MKQYTRSAFRLLLGWMVAVCFLTALCPLASIPATLRIVTFGDSTTAERLVEGVPLRVYATSLAADSLLRERGVNIINAGVPANTTRDARQRFQRDVVDRRPDIVIIQFGINDSTVDVWKNPPATDPRVSLEDYTENLSWFVTELQKHGVQPILMTPNPLSWTDGLRSLYGASPYDPNDPDGFNVLLRNYAQSVREVASRTGTSLIDVHAAFQAHTKKHPGDLLLLDGMHPNEKGHRIIADLLKQQLASIQTTSSPAPADSAKRAAPQIDADLPTADLPQPDGGR